MKIHEYKTNIVMTTLLNDIRLCDVFGDLYILMHLINVYLVIITTDWGFNSVNSLSKCTNLMPSVSTLSNLLFTLLYDCVNRLWGSSMSENDSNTQETSALEPCFNSPSWNFILAFVYLRNKTLKFILSCRAVKARYQQHTLSCKVYTLASIWWRAV